MGGCHGQFSLRGRTAVVTGGVGGMGEGFSKALIEHGANVAVFDLKMPPESLVALAYEHSVTVKGYM